MNKDEIIYFLKRNRVNIVLAVIVFSILIAYAIYCFGGHSNTDDPTNTDNIIVDGSAIGLDGTVYENDYVNTNLELQQIIIEGSWIEGQQYNVYFDRVNNEYSVWKVNKTASGSTLEQVEYEYSLIGKPSELTEIPNSSLLDTEELIELDADFYVYKDIAQAYGYLNSKLNEGYVLKYIKIQNDLYEAYYVKSNKVYHVIATNSLLLNSEYTGKLASGMIDTSAESETNSNLE